MDKLVNEGDVLLDVVRPSSSTNDGGPTGVYLGGPGPKKRIDYVLVYETCEEKENEDEESQKKAKDLDDQRKAFESSIESEGLILDHTDVISPQVSQSRSITWNTMHSQRNTYVI